MFKNRGENYVSQKPNPRTYGNGAVGMIQRMISMAPAPAPVRCCLQIIMRLFFIMKHKVYLCENLSIFDKR